MLLEGFVAVSPEFVSEVEFDDAAGEESEVDVELELEGEVEFVDVADEEPEGDVELEGEGALLSEVVVELEL